MAAPVSIRLRDETRKRVARIARRKKVHATALMRQAIEQMVEKEDRQLPPYERLKDLIGVVHSGDPHLSQDIGRKFAELLRKRRARS
jgi:predicted DNA-binding protein